MCVAPAGRAVALEGLERQLLISAQRAAQPQRGERCGGVAGGGHGARRSASQGAIAARTADRSPRRLWSPAHPDDGRRGPAGGMPNGSRAPCTTSIGTSRRPARAGGSAPGRPGDAAGTRGRARRRRRRRGGAARDAGARRAAARDDGRPRSSPTRRCATTAAHAASSCARRRRRAAAGDAVRLLDERDATPAEPRPRPRAGRAPRRPRPRRGRARVRPARPPGADGRAPGRAAFRSRRRSPAHGAEGRRPPLRALELAGPEVAPAAHHARLAVAVGGRPARRGVARVDGGRSGLEVRIARRRRTADRCSRCSRRRLPGPLWMMSRGAQARVADDGLRRAAVAEPLQRRAAAAQQRVAQAQRRRPPAGAALRRARKPVRPAR